MQNFNATIRLILIDFMARKEQQHIKNWNKKFIKKTELGGKKQKQKKQTNKKTQ